MTTNLMKNEPETNKTNELTNLLKSHLNSFIEKDLQKLISDYTNESVFITQDKIYTGVNEIKDFFTNLMVYFPEHQSTIELDKMVVTDEIGFIVWHANTPTVTVPFATDTFVFKNGKIFQQTFAGQLNFIKD